MEIVRCRAHRFVGLRLQVQATSVQEGKALVFAFVECLAGEPALPANRGCVGQRQQALGGAGIGHARAAVLRAQVNRGATRQTALAEDIGEFAVVVAGEKNIVPVERQPRCR